MFQSALELRSRQLIHKLVLGIAAILLVALIGFGTVAAQTTIITTSGTGYSTTNHNHITVINSSHQSAHSGNASSSGNTNGGNATSGNASNSNSSTTTIHIGN